jgi:hypothetical protein
MGMVHPLMGRGWLGVAQAWVEVRLGVTGKELRNRREIIIVLFLLHRKDLFIYMLSLVRA